MLISMLTELRVGKKETDFDDANINYMCDLMGALFDATTMEWNAYDASCWCSRVPTIVGLKFQKIGPCYTRHAYSKLLNFPKNNSQLHMFKTMFRKLLGLLRILPWMY